MDTADAMATFKATIDAVRAAIGLAKEANQLGIDSIAKSQAQLSLDKADNAVLLAEADLARALGYKICHCSFPPQVMLKVGRDAKSDRAIHKCSKCGDQIPTEKSIREWKSTSEIASEMGRSMRQHGDWMGT